MKSPKGYAIQIIMSTFFSLMATNRKNYLTILIDKLTEMVNQELDRKVSERTIRRYVDELVRDGFFERVQRKKRLADGRIISLSNLYKPLPKAWKWAHMHAKRLFRLLKLTGRPKMASKNLPYENRYYRTGRERSERAGFLPNGDLFIPGVGQLKPASAFKH